MSVSPGDESRYQVPSTHTVVLAKVPAAKQEVIKEAVQQHAAGLRTGSPQRNPSCIQDKRDQDLRVVYANFKSAEGAQQAVTTLRCWLVKRTWRGAQNIQVYVKAEGLADEHRASVRGAMATTCSSALSKASPSSPSSPSTEAPVPSPPPRGACGRGAQSQEIAERAGCSTRSHSRAACSQVSQEDREPDGAGAGADYDGILEGAGSVPICEMEFFMTSEERAEEEQQEEIEEQLFDDWCKQNQEDGEDHLQHHLELTAEIDQGGEEFLGIDWDTPAARKRKHVLEGLILTVGQVIGLF